MKTFKQILKWTGIVAVAAIGLLLIINAVLLWTSGRQLEEHLSALRAAGEPVTIKDLAGAPIPAEENAATYLDRARSDVEAMAREMDPVISGGLDKPRLTEEEQQMVRSAFEAHPKVLPLLEEAAARQKYQPAIDYTLPPPGFLQSLLDNMSYPRTIARVLRARSRFDVSQNKPDEALNRATLLLRLCRHFDRNPMTTSFLMSIACRGMAADMADVALRSGPVSAQAREAFDQELARHNMNESFRRSLETERAYGLDSFRTLPGSSINPLWKYEKIVYLDVLDQYMAAVSRPYRDQLKTASQLKDSVQRQHAFLTGLVLPSVDATRDATLRIAAQLRCLRVLNALQIHEKDGTALPDLAELGLPDQATVDPFTGRPLTIKRAAGGWLVYSVGKDLKDDGGKLANFDDVGVGPVETAGDLASPKDGK